MTLKGFFGTTSTVITLALIVTSISFQALYAQEKEGNKRVYRWVDENGDVHYTESLPPDYQGETHDELSHDGIVRDEAVSRKPPPPKAQPADEAAIKTGPSPEDIAKAQKQEQIDRLLLLRYQTEEELLEARDVEVNQLKYDEQLLSATRESLSSSLKSSIVTAGHRQRAGMEIPPETLKQIASIRARLEENERSLRGLQIREENVRNGFDERLARYRELVELYSEEDT